MKNDFAKLVAGLAALVFLWAAAGVRAEYVSAPTNGAALHLTLAQAIDEALKANPGLRAAGHQANAAEGEASAAARTRLGGLNATGSYSYLSDDQIIRPMSSELLANGFAGAPWDRSQAHYGLDYEIPLFLGGRLNNQIQIARLEARKAAELLEGTRWQVRFNVVSLYSTLQALDQNQVSGVVDVRLQQPADLPRLNVAASRDKASEMNLTERDVANAMLLGLSGNGQVQPMYWLNPKNGVQYLINVRVPQPDMDSLAAMNAIPVGASQPGKGDTPLLANLATVQRANVPPIVSHYNVMPVLDVFAGVSGRDLGGVLHDLKPLIAQAEKELPRGSFIILRGQAQTMNSSYRGLGLGLLMAIALIFLLLVVNFQSWLDPFIIISALPAALTGVAWGLYFTFTPLSVPALMGAIMSLGVATANSVLVVSFARSLLREGADPLTAALNAGAGRLRPVLMTALAMIIGMLPMALGLGEGGEQNAPLGRAVIGGLAVATFATLFFVPAVFTLLHRRAAVKTAEDFDAGIPPATPTT
jgi:hypothetical protein